MKKAFFILLTFFSCLAVMAADNINFRLSAPSAVVAGQQFRVEYVVNGDGKDFRVADFDKMNVLMGPSVSTSMSTQIINGKMSAETSKTFTYVLMSSEEGTFNIPSATIKVDGKQYTSNSAQVKVLPKDKASESQQQGKSGSNQQEQGLGPNDVFVRLLLSKTKAYEGEAILATCKLYTVNSQTQLQDAKFPSFDGFTVQEVQLPDQKSYELENYNGRNYYTVALRQYLLFPQRSGKIDIAPVSLDLVIPIRVQQRMRSIFDDFFDNYQNVSKSVASGTQTVTVQPLPSGKPESFLGGVGEFKISSSMSATNVRANEAITLKLTISGNGNVKYIKTPELKLPADFEVYDPKVDVSIKSSSSGVTGSKVIEYTMIPRYAGDFEIPAVKFSYFNVKTKSYQTVSTDSYKVTVEKSLNGENSSPGVSNFTGTGNHQEAVKQLAKDIRYIKSGNFRLRKEIVPFYGTMSYWLFYIIPAIIFGILFFVYRKQVKENANTALMRTKKASKVASKRLKAAAGYLKNHKKEEFYEEVLRAVWGYLSDKLNMPLSVLNRDNVEAELRSHKVDEALIKQYMDIISTCEFARYAPSQGDQAMDQLYSTTVSAIDQMENVIRK